MTVITKCAVAGMLHGAAVYSVRQERLKMAISVLEQ